MVDKELKPRLRFSGFTDAWEKRQLGEVASETFGGGTPKTSDEILWDGDIPWFQSSDLILGEIRNVQPKKFINQEAIKKSAAKLVPANSIAIVTRVGVGKLAIIPFSYATSQDFLSLSKLSAEPHFIAYWLYKEFYKVINSLQGTSIKGITKDELLALSVKLPTLPEQTAIGNFFAQLDRAIALQERRFKKHKPPPKSQQG